MKNALIALGVTVIFLGMSGCGSDDESSGTGGTNLEFARASLTALPSVLLSTATLQNRMAIMATPTQRVFNNFFKLECWYNDANDFCPSTVTKTSDNKLTMGSLLGNIYHAQMYGGLLVKECTAPGRTSKTITAASYKAESSTGANPTKFLIGDMWDQYTCRDTNMDDPTTQVRMISTDATGTYQSSLTTRYHYNNSTGADFFQTFVSVNSEGKPQLLAFNFSGSDNATKSDRTILLVNLINHKFALKHFAYNWSTTSGVGENYIVATGVGGLDILTGARNAGYFYVAMKDQDDSSTPTSKCINNADNTIVADTDCTNASVPTTWTSSDTIKTYLEITEADAAKIAPFLARFAAATPLSISNGDVASTAGDVARYFPATME